MTLIFYFANENAENAAAADSDDTLSLHRLRPCAPPLI
jgi:hypothetical protein